VIFAAGFGAGAPLAAFGCAETVVPGERANERTSA